MDTNSIIHSEDSNHLWTLNFTASGSPEIDTEVAKAATGADSTVISAPAAELDTGAAASVAVVSAVITTSSV